MQKKSLSISWGDSSLEMLPSKALLLPQTNELLICDIHLGKADSFAMSFDEEWQKVNCNDIVQKIDKVIEILSDHPFVISNVDNARKIANFRIYSLKKFQ